MKSVRHSQNKIIKFTEDQSRLNYAHHHPPIPLQDEHILISRTSEYVIERKFHYKVVCLL